MQNSHPIYKNIMKEYITDGKYYYSNDGKKRYAGDEYYKVIEDDIKKSTQKLPLTVSGDVAWVLAQTSPDHLRLTLIDSGYINPKKRTATIKFHTAVPTKIPAPLNHPVPPGQHGGDAAARKHAGSRRAGSTRRVRPRTRPEPGEG